MKKIISPVTLLLVIACNNNGKKNGSITTPPPTKIMSYSIVATYPHDTSSYTQGLTFYKGEMYEGTGNYGKSRLKKTDLQSGKTIREISLDKEYFGEGITILNDTIYQLTWKEKKVFAYTLKDFKKVKEFTIETEGWGLTTDGRYLIASDGSSTLYYYEPSSFRLVKTQDVTEAGNLSYNLNELEFIDGFIYANQYQAPYIFKIDPSNGAIVAKADLTAIWDRIRAIDPDADVPNGIAFDAASKKVYITGKWWPELYEVQFSQ